MEIDQRLTAVAAVAVTRTDSVEQVGFDTRVAGRVRNRQTLSRDLLCFYRVADLVIRMSGQVISARFLKLILCRLPESERLFKLRCCCASCFFGLLVEELHALFDELFSVDSSPVLFGYRSRFLDCD